MLVLVLADNLVFLYLGWEGVGLCSYLLIGFWYQDPANGRAARKAFIVTRVGDMALALGLFLLFSRVHTLDIQAAMGQAAASDGSVPDGSGLAVIALLLLAGAAGKSAQLPLQTWLPDAMAGPTPVSALIHAATMVTAGVYLIARTHVLFELAPGVQALVGWTGAATLLLAAVSALTQRDIKRILAYSTMSQIGYMFLALGVGAWSAAVFHLMTHAFFKALLFLAAGAVIVHLRHEHDIYRMGGLRRRLPLVFASFLIGSAALAALPLVTAGFYSKEAILTAAWSSGHGLLWLAGLAGAFLTALYIFRAVFIVFYGKPHTAGEGGPGWRMQAALLALAGLSVTGGFFPPPLQTALPDAAHHGSVILGIIASAVSLAGIVLAYRLFLRGLRPEDLLPWSSPWEERWRRFWRRLDTSAMEVRGWARRRGWERFWFGGWGFDRLYRRLFVRPFLFLARVSRRDPVDDVYAGVALLSRRLHLALSGIQTGHVRWYAALMAGGAVLAIALTVLA
ncbi:MAG: NADH-quinone oxidoreductase subunit L, partial [Pseudomonadota bacterium]|nr:NADH-quinone oxidoreductase subunit L [Pseudomonadota bacterium]